MKATQTYSTTIEDFIDEVADTHRISSFEAVDEVWDAIETLWAPEDRPAAYLTTDQQRALRNYIGEQYATNRTRL